MKILYFTLIFLISLSVLNAQELENFDKPKLQFGLFSGILFNRHIAEITSLTNVTNCCPNYNDGQGNGYQIGLLSNLSVFQNFGLGLRFGFKSSMNSFSSNKKTELNSDTGLVIGLYEQIFKPSFKSISATPIINFSPVNNFKIFVGSELELLLKSNFEQEELVIDENKSFFPEGTKTRNFRAGIIGDINKFQLNIISGFSYSFSLNNKKIISIIPDIYYSIPVFDIVNNSTWKNFSLQLGFSLLFSKESAEHSINLPEPLAVKRDGITASVNLVGVNDSLIEFVKPVIQLEEFETSTTHQLLGYIFFDEDSTNIPPRYSKISSYQTKIFSIDSLFGMNQIEVYHNILNIIGKRLILNPLATITVTGCNQDFRNEADNTPLSRRRAKEVSNYLEDVWSINPNRIKIEVRNLPEIYSQIKTANGFAENRRVEITSQTSSILEPIHIEDTLIQISPLAIRFKPQSNCEVGLHEWFIEIRQFPDFKKISNKTDDIEDIDWQIRTDSILKKPQQLVKTSINYQLRVKDNNGDTASTPAGVINVNYISLDQKRKQATTDYKTDRYSVLFNDSIDYILNLKTIEFLNYIKSKISSNSKVTISGQTDSLGDEANNLIISKRRAIAVAKALRQNQKNAIGLGSVIAALDSELPEGRLYKRCVNIIVETPINK